MEGPIELSGRGKTFMQLELSIHSARAAGKRLLVALVDLDKFYRVNETRGTAFGNDVLKIVASRLEQTEATYAEASKSGVCKVDGNTFLVMMEVEKDAPQYWKAVDAIKHAVEQPVSDSGKELYMTCSIGVSLFPQDGLTSERLLCRTESALYQAKEIGGNRTVFYNTEDTDRMNRRIAIEMGLRPALFLRQFHLSYQPIYRLSDGRLKGFEALIRWQHPELGLISPNEFIPIAEYNGLINPIGEWVLREACKMLKGMTTYGLNELTMSVNISPVQLQDASFVQTVWNILQEFGMSRQSLELDITEHSTMHSSKLSITAITQLRAGGVRIALDGFGAGFSSLHHLMDLPVHCLKLDKSYIRRIDLQSAERHVVEAIIGLMRKLGLEVVAEGVEYKEQYELLQKWGCHYVQGYLLGMPLDPTVIDMSMLASCVPTPGMDELEKQTAGRT
ncbi:putative bifunctional diguanylate cyclase/phosphodiesterase [Paenibacillus paeoniae]|uniref:Bifunctional diguanylate cyclase/phosphodiesterase n=1 Tax=Paenibacillus paeoniae TaxID=2292705 RepID=A0A371PEP5_9BACL|nr:bifunctional diguanylate cyclase/phosphodiesterase [Paenibacillus paeoniae]REK74369.1 bifunctional diguanylate cyclase/phosphodiesterase [Paenibacillus paeoniae]